MKVARREPLGVRRTLFHCVMTSDSVSLRPLLPFPLPFLLPFLNSRGMLTRGAKAANDDDSESAVFDDALMALQVNSRPFWLQCSHFKFSSYVLLPILHFAMRGPCGRKCVEI